MAQGDTTKLVIELQVLLRNLNQTLRGLDQIKKKLESVANIKIKTSTQATDKTVSSAQRLVQQQQRLSVQAQELANRQERARQAAERLAVSQQRVGEATRVSLGKQQDAHVQAFRAIEKARNSALKLVEQTLGRVGGSLRNLGLGLTSLGSSLTLALTTPLTALGILATRNAITLDSLRRGLVAITGSADEAGQQLARLTQIAKLPGIGFQEAIQGSIRLQAVGFSAEKAEKALREFSNAVALTGGGRAELDRITVQLGQLSAKGKVLSQDLKPIIEAGPAVGRALKEAFGTVNAQDIQELGLSSEQFLDQLVKQLETLPRAGAGFRNTFDNFADAVFRASSAIGEAIIPVLTRLVDIAEPIITRLAAGFKQLPPAIQSITVVLGGLLAAFGPALFIIGQFATGIGGIVSAFGRLYTLLQLTIPAIRGVTAALTAQQAAAAGLGVALGGIGLVIATIGLLAAALFALGGKQKDAIQITREQIAANEAEIDSLKSQVKFLDSLQKGVARTADEQRRLNEIYFALNTQARVRVAGITEEEKRTAQLREELQRLLSLRNEERTQQAANLIATLASTVAEKKATDDSRAAIARRIAANTELRNSIQQTGHSTQTLNRILDQQNLTGLSTEQAMTELGKANEKLTGIQDEAIKSSEKLNNTAEEQGQLLARLQRQTGLSARELLTAAKAMGVFKGDIETTLPLLEKFIDLEDHATAATDAFQRALAQQAKDLLASGDAVESLIKSDKALINAAVQVAKEATNSFEGARKSLQAFIAAQPLLAQAVENERRRAGKSLGDFLNDILLEGADRKTENVLRKQLDRVREAQDRLSEARAEGQIDLLRSRIESEFTATKNGLDRELNELQQNFDDRLVALKSYLKQRRDLEESQIDAEIAKELELTSVLFQQLNARSRAAIAEFQTEVKGINEDPKLTGRAKQTAIEAAQLKKTTEFQKALDEFTVKNEESKARIVELEKQRKGIVGELLRLEARLTEEINKQRTQVQFDLLEEQGRTADAEAGRLKARFTETLRDLRIDITGLGKDLQTALTSVDLTTLQQRLDDLPEPIRTLIELLDIGIKRAQIIEASRLVDDLSAGLRLDEQRIQNRVLDGLASQREAQAEILALQRQYRDVLLDVLKGELAKAEAIKDQGQIVAIQAQIAEVERLGIAIDEAGQEINRALFSDLQSGLSGIFSGARRGFEGLRDAAVSFGERLLDTLNDIAATSIVRQLEGLFKPDAQNTQGTIGGFISKLFGLQPKQTADAATASATLQTGATTAAATLSTGITTAATGFGSAVVTAATSFDSLIVSAGAAFAGAVAAGSAAQSVGGLGSALGGAATGLFPAVPGGLYKVVEGGYPEAVLTTDPKHASRQLAILRAFLHETKGLGGKIKGFAAGAMLTPTQIEANLLSGISTTPLSNASIGEFAVAGTPSMMKLRQVLVDERDVGNWVNSPEGERVLVDFLSKNQPVIRKLSGK